MNQTATTTKQIVRFDVFTRNNYTQTDRQRDCVSYHPPTLAGLAAALDRARLDGIEQRGYSGSGAGAWVEAVFDVDVEDINVRVDGINSPVLAACSPLEVGASRLALARRAGRLERERAWNGNNFVTVGADATRQLIETLYDANH